KGLRDPKEPTKRLVPADKAPAARRGHEPSGRGKRLLLKLPVLKHLASLRSVTCPRPPPRAAAAIRPGAAPAPAAPSSVGASLGPRRTATTCRPRLRPPAH